MRWAVGVLAVVVVLGVYLSNRDDRATQQALTDSAVQRAVDSVAVVGALAARDSALDLYKSALRMRPRVPVARPLPIPPDTTVADTIRYLREALDSTSLTLQETRSAFDSLTVAFDRLTDAFHAQEAANERFRVAYVGELERADGLTLALRKASTCRKVLGLIPLPRVVLGYGVMESGGVVRTGPAVAVGIPLGCK